MDGKEYPCKNMKKILIISPYAKAGKYAHRESALASFNLNLVSRFGKKIKAIILSDSEDRQNSVYKSWSKNDPATYQNIIKSVSKYPEIQTVLIQFEWGVFGKSLLYVVLFPALILALKLMGKKPLIVLHGVNFRFENIFGRNFKSYFLNAGGWIFYTISTLLSHKVIVTESFFKHKIERLPFCKNKVEFIPHGVDSQINANKNRKKLSPRLELGYFGFINPYKGPDRLLRLYEKADRNKYGLSLYGGFSPNLINDYGYQNYVKSIKKTAKSLGVKISGFLEESQIKNAFLKTDLVIFPYPVFISSSGMLAMTFAYEKPFLISKPLSGYFQSPDFTEALRKAGLSKKDVCFDFNQKDFTDRLLWAKKNLNKLILLSRIMKKARDWRLIAKKYEKILD